MVRIRHLLWGVLSAAVLAAAAAPAAAQESAMSCDALWYARNTIYARNGYCFQTARARSVFGPGCFPPFGQLRGRDRARVNALQYWERVRGCSG